MVELVEVSPRDGLQNESRILPTETKVELVRRAVAAGVRRIEVASFVNPAKVPQMADAEAVAAALPDCGATYIGLVLNEAGARRALATRLHELGVVCAATDSFGVRNQGRDWQASTALAGELVELAHAEGRSAQVTIAVAFGCPFEGEVDQDRVVEIARRLARSSPREIALADTIGAAGPSEVEALVTKVRAAVAPIPVRVHFHDTRNTGVANAWAAWRAGATTIDASIGGLGGCPFAPGAAGNVATEDVLYMLGRAGAAPAVDVGQISDAARWLCDLVGRAQPGKVSVAPPFPSPKTA